MGKIESLQDFYRQLPPSIAGFPVFNAITTVSSNYGVTLVVRFLAGMGQVLSGRILTGYAKRTVQRQMERRAITLITVGHPPF